MDMKEQVNQLQEQVQSMTELVGQLLQERAAPLSLPSSPLRAAGSVTLSHSELTRVFCHDRGLLIIPNVMRHLGVQSLKKRGSKITKQILK